jgi:pimeloyl-ACP methyl ester carboxylesterase
MKTEPGTGADVATPIPGVRRVSSRGQQPAQEILEVPIWIPSREMLGAVVSFPSVGTSDLGVVLMAGRARDRSHRNAMWARAARELSARGLYVLRLDYPGVGHSSGDPQIFDLESPPAWAMEDACRFLVEETPVERIILAGSCFGARMALRAARGLDRVESVAMVAGPVYARRPSLARRLVSFPRRVLGLQHSDRAADNPAQQRREGNLATERRVSPSFERGIRAVTTRCPVYFLYGADDFSWQELRFALEKVQLPEDRYELDVVPGTVHSFQSIDVQELTIRRLVAWCSRFASPGVTPT